jgi:hypothetical protein
MKNDKVRRITSRLRVGQSLGCFAIVFPVFFLTATWMWLGNALSFSDTLREGWDVLLRV